MTLGKRHFKEHFSDGLDYLRRSFSTGNPSNICLFKVNNRNTRKKCEIFSKLTIKTPEQLHWRRSGVLISNNEHISHLFLAFLLLNLNKKMLTRFVLLLFSIKEQISIRFSPTGNNRFIKKNLYGPFLWVGFNYLKATEALRAGSLLFTTTFLLFLLLFY